jgi:hypothetical protein
MHCCWCWALPVTRRWRQHTLRGHCFERRCEIALTLDRLELREDCLLEGEIDLAERIFVGEQRLQHGRNDMLAADRADVASLPWRPAIEPGLLLGDRRMLVEASPDQIVDREARFLEVGLRG